MPGPQTDLNDATGNLREVYSVSRLNAEVRLLLESGFPSLWLEGEISNLARPASGHLYFSLKDDKAQVRCAMFRQRNSRLRFAPANGQQVLVRARISLYEARGEFQLLVEHMEEAGEGLLRQRFEALKARLAAEGLFDTSHKQALPPLPGRIGVVTSPSGAAIRDVLKILRRRFPAVPVRIYPVLVQGDTAAGQIAAAIDLADRRQDCDVLIVTRGGGSLEDLWAFNEEVVARAVYRCELPVISAIGHEIDVTITDLVADHRAPTPSGAAEIVVPDRGDWLRRLGQLAERALLQTRRLLARQKESLGWVGKRLEQRDPRHLLRQQAQRLDELQQRLQRAQHHVARHKGAQVRELAARLMGLSPLIGISRRRDRLRALAEKLASLTRRQVSEAGSRLGSLARTLQAVSPLATLDRGYSIVYDEAGNILHDAASTAVGDRIEARLAKGRIRASVDAIDKED